jgi:hypothetical protein
MPQYYRFPGQPAHYTATARLYGHSGHSYRGAETKSLGSYGSLGYAHGALGYAHGALGSRYLGPVPPEDLGPIPKSLGKLNVYGYAGGQDLGYVSNFGGQNKDISLESLRGILPALSDNEKRLVTIGVIGVVAWLAFGDKIKKALKK